ncbi:hypothetical protein FBUS_02415 [Fasciolopsis buskii]|uniref:Uncharacterized protein n=1 Tax=Fasciolopsis buskii TaxID=27845 RepID=A0A8E0VH27_9TREM|nr:hypothetical protein FBUS_02415 [Fasciolopsis buski]
METSVKENRIDCCPRPDKFVSDIKAHDAPKWWTYWLRTFNAFPRLTETDETDKLDMIINFLTPHVYEPAFERQTLGSSVEKLKSSYVHRTNVIFIRYLLVTLKQKVGQYVDQFVQNTKGS